MDETAQMSQMLLYYYVIYFCQNNDKQYKTIKVYLYCTSRCRPSTVNEVVILTQTMYLYLNQALFAPKHNHIFTIAFLPAEILKSTLNF